jgi:hypothetical protein
MKQLLAVLRGLGNYTNKTSLLSSREQELDHGPNGTEFPSSQPVTLLPHQEYSLSLDR